jgi:hypothetical protein
MNDKRIDQYLRKSTRGLWGRKRAEVKEEISTHIQGRVNAHLIAGFNERDAIEKTLAELGHPAHVSAGMARLHSLPIVAGSGMMLALCCALVVVWLSGSTAQTLQVTNIFPAEECLLANETFISVCESQGLWVGIDELQAILEPQGVKFSEQYNLTILEFPDGKTFPIAPPTEFDFVKVEKTLLDPQPGYVRLEELIWGLTSRRDTLIMFEGWESAVIRVGDVSVEMPKENEMAGGSYFYSSHFSNVLLKGSRVFDDAFANKSVLFYDFVEDDNRVRSVNVRVPAKEGTVYGIAMLQEPHELLIDFTSEDQIDLALYFNVAPTSADGTVSFDVSKKDFVFDDDSVGFGKALLVRLSGEFRGQAWEIIPPDQIRLE